MSDCVTSIQNAAVFHFEGFFNEMLTSALPRSLAARLGDAFSVACFPC